MLVLSKQTCLGLRGLWPPILMSLSGLCRPNFRNWPLDLGGSLYLEPKVPNLVRQADIYSLTNASHAAKHLQLFSSVLQARELLFRFCVSETL